jgi:chemotaxis family two-component system sensor kinase Cph1
MLKPEPVEQYGSNAGCPVPIHADTLHDLAGPVNQLSTMLALFEKRHRVASDGDSDVLFGMILSSAGRLRSLIGGFQTYTRVVDSPAPRRICDAEGLVEAALSPLAPAIHESDAVITHDRLPELDCDPNQIIHALASLIDNSIKFRGERRPEIHVSAAADENEWIFSVRDNGIGIDPKHRERIFHLFKRLNGDKYPGAGVGLSICKAVIARHCGRIWLGTPSERGAIFHFTLPRVETVHAMKPPNA